MQNSARYWREIPQRYRMEAGKCASCGAICFPPRRRCPECGSCSFQTVKLGDHGKILTYTVIRVAPAQFSDQVPYAVAIVELDGGGRITTQIADCEFDQLAIGQRVRLEFRKVQKDGAAGILCYGYKFVQV